MSDVEYYEERREFLRIDYEAPIEVSLFTDDVVSKVPESMTKNVSACGILFASKKSMEVGTLLAINPGEHTLSDVIEIDDSVLMIGEKLLGRVVRVEEIVTDKEFDIGVCFVKNTEIDEDDVAKLVGILS